MENNSNENELNPEDEPVASNQSSNNIQSRGIVSRLRNLVSQRTLEENILDNQFNNYPQNVNNAANEIEDNESTEDDRLFEEYIQEAQTSQSQLFDSELATQHIYLGETENVRGISYFEPLKIYEIPICEHHSMIFPGEILPMILLEDRFFSLSNEDEGLVFGLIFQKEYDEKRTYGVTCQIFEKGSQNGLVKIKSKAQQRFVVVKTNNEDSIVSRNNGYYAKVKILPEILLRDPHFLTISNNHIKYLTNPSSQHQLKKFLAYSTIWPTFVYEDYSLTTITDKIERYLAMLNIEAPQDPVLKSFWLARNVPLNNKVRQSIFQSDCVNKRLILIGESLNYMCYFLCKRCRNKIAIYNDIFAMSNAVNANYCNPGGYVHECITLHKTFETAVKMVDRPSTEFSWFPGYAWQIAICSKCYTHVGWKFIAVNNRNLRPRTFFGLSCKSLLVQSEHDLSEKENEEQESIVSDSE